MVPTIEKRIKIVVMKVVAAIEIVETIQDLNDRNARLRWIRKSQHVILPVWTQTEAQCDKHQQGVE